MNSKLKTLSKNSAIIGIGALISKGFAFIISFILANFLNTESYGSLDMLMTYVSLALPFTTLELNQAMYRNILEDSEHANYYFAKTFKFVISIALVYSILVLLFVQIQYKIYVIFYFLSTVIFNITIEYTRGIKKLEIYSLCNILNSMLLFLLLLIIQLFGSSVQYVLIAYVLSNLVCSLFIIVKFKLHKNNLNNNIRLKEMLSYSVPLIPNGISWWITNASDRIIINNFLGNRFNGIYAMSYKIPTLISSFYSIFNLSFQQTAFLDTNDYDFYKKLYAKLFVFLLSMGGIIIILIPYIFLTLLPSTYTESMIYIPFLLSGTIFLSLSQYIGNILLAERKTRVIGLSTTVAAILNIIINLVFIKYIGLYAAAISTMMSYLILYVLRYICQGKQMIEMSFLFKTIVSMTFFLCLSYMYISQFKFNYFFVALSLCFITLFCFLNKEIIIIFRKKIMNK